MKNEWLKTGKYAIYTLSFVKPRTTIKKKEKNIYITTQTHNKHTNLINIYKIYT